jgi:hypothetical protein
MVDHRIALAIRQALAALRRGWESFLTALHPRARSPVCPAVVPTEIARRRARRRLQP